VDGTGKKRYKGDISINNGLIKEIGTLDKEGNEIMDIQGLIIAPGFIDTHSHSDLFLIHDPSSLPKIMQGITTEIIGQDGLGEAPIREEYVPEWRRYLSGLNGDPPIKWTWTSFKEYLDVLEEKRTSVNVAGLVGHGNLRLLAMGMDDRNPSYDEMEEMKKLLNKSIQEGAIGLSTGLIYAPCIYANTHELIELCKVVKKYSGVFAVHMRDEGDKLLESIDEVITIAREAEVHSHISHFKAGGSKNWGKSRQGLQSLERAQEQGLNISYDQYPYTAGSTFLSSLLPKWIHNGGVDKLLKRLKEPSIREKIKTEYQNTCITSRTTGWDKVLVTYVESIANKDLEGKNLIEIAQLRGQSPIYSLMDLVLEEKNKASMASFTMSEKDVELIMKHPLGMICTDGLLLGKPHPRAYGAFPRVLGYYVRQRKILSLEEVVRKMTSYPCKIFKLGKRGKIQPGFIADLVVFNPDTIIDYSTYQNPRLHPEGIIHVTVSGVLSVINGRYTGIRNGKIIRFLKREIN
jgi:N-acyl-D-amino-acid deacylase